MRLRQAPGRRRPLTGANQAVIQGRVTRGGAPVADGYVRLLDAGGEFTAEVPSATGQFRFFAAPGSWTLRAWPRAGIRAEQVRLGRHRADQQPGGGGLTAC